MVAQEYWIYASVLLLSLAKIVSFYALKHRVSMFNKSGSVLTSIPETSEEEDTRKWVPKKKHDVLKAKYKCLKKLFQIYDASVIGILPEPCAAEAEYADNETRSRSRHRRKRSHRTKTDACAGTTELTSGDVTDAEEVPKPSMVATEVIRELKIPQCSCTSSQLDAVTTTTITQSKLDRYATTEHSKTNITEQEYKGSEMTHTVDRSPDTVPYLMVADRPRLTRFQCFIQRIFGIRREDRSYKNLVPLNCHVYAASDNNILPYEKRRRRGLRFRKLRKPKKIQSESALNVKSPMILTYVQSVQKNCLMDTTPRQCPIMGCRMIFYGIINYNDHLNLCHFTERKHICHYCHEGFEREQDKYVHESEHIGISKLSLPNVATRQRVASITQTDPELTKCDLAEDKLRKIVSFFDKLANPDQIVTEIKKKINSESNIHSSHRSKDDCSENISSNSETDQRTVSCVSLHGKKKVANAVESRLAAKYSCSSNRPVTCQLCGENFDYRRQLSLHVDLEHRVHDKFSKFHSCAGITNTGRRCDLITKDGKIDFKSEDKKDKDLRRKSEESLAYEPSTNIVYYTSMESVNSKVPMGYKWEPGTKIIRV